MENQKCDYTDDDGVMIYLEEREKKNERKEWFFALYTTDKFCALCLLASAGFKYCLRRKTFTNTTLSDLTIVATCDTLVYRMRHQSMRSNRLVDLK